MKLHADRAEGVNLIQSYTADALLIEGQAWRSSILVPSTGPVTLWNATSLADLTEAHFELLAQARPELVIFGSGKQLRFVRPALLRPLMTARIGIETMDTQAACRTYNILVSEGRKAMAALIMGS
jgi:uncharacterized protein